jgi:DNA-binding transcriptional LysR family regulator
MQLTHLRNADLNLLPALLVLLEERQISKAANRFNLSQPAMSRILQRLRQTFDDELLIRTAEGYELTAKARALQDELQTSLGQLDRMLRGEVFDPATATDTFRICCPDHASLAFAPVLAERLARDAPQTKLEIIAWHEKAFSDAIRGRLDLVLWANEVPPPLESELLVEDRMVCVMSANHPIGEDEFTLEKYLAYPHVHVTVKAERQYSIAGQLAHHGARRHIALRVPYFGAAVLSVAGTQLIATVPHWATYSYRDNTSIRIVEPPVPLQRPRNLMAWHPRMNAAPAHKWFRGIMLEAVATLVSRGGG